MKNTVYYIAVHTSQTFEEHEYVEQAGLMMMLLNDIFNDKSKLDMLLGTNTPVSVHTEVEISQEVALTGKAIVDIKAEGKVTLDKSKLSSMIKATSPWRSVKIEKRQVQVEEEA